MEYLNYVYNIQLWQIILLAIIIFVYTEYVHYRGVQKGIDITSKVASDYIIDDKYTYMSKGILRTLKYLIENNIIKNVNGIFEGYGGNRIDINKDLESLLNIEKDIKGNIK